MLGDEGRALSDFLSGTIDARGIVVVDVEVGIVVEIVDVRPVAFVVADKPTVF